MVKTLYTLFKKNNKTKFPKGILHNNTVENKLEKKMLK